MLDWAFRRPEVASRRPGQASWRSGRASWKLEWVFLGAAPSVFEARLGVLNARLAVLQVEGGVWARKGPQQDTSPEGFSVPRQSRNQYKINAENDVFAGIP